MPISLHNGGTDDRFSSSVSPRPDRRPKAIVCHTLFLFVAIALAGCRQDMHDQPKYRALRKSSFFADGRDSRPLVAGTVARGELHEDSVFYTGKSGQVDKDGIALDTDVFPIEVTKAVIERGQNRFNIYCSPCHGMVGNGQGMIVRRGFKQPPSYHIDRLRQAPIGHFFDVMTNGYGAMLDYSAQVEPGDRWAIASYIRALQYSQNVSVNDLSAEDRAKLPSPDQTALPQVPKEKEIQGFPEKPAVPKGVPGTPSAPPVKGGEKK